MYHSIHAGFCFCFIIIIIIIIIIITEPDLVFWGM